MNELTNDKWINKLNEQTNEKEKGNAYINKCNEPMI